MTNNANCSSVISSTLDNNNNKAQTHTQTDNMLIYKVHKMKLETQNDQLSMYYDGIDADAFWDRDVSMAIKWQLSVDTRSLYLITVRE